MYKSKEEFENKKRDVIEKFDSEFTSRYYNKSPLFNHVYELLIRDANPYEIIQKLIEQHEKDIEIMQEYYANHAKPIIIQPTTTA